MIPSDATRPELIQLLSKSLSTLNLENRVFFRVDPYDIISILLETLCYGIFVVLFFLSTALLLRRRRVTLNEKTNESTKLTCLMVYLVTGGMMFLTITAKWTFWWAEVLPIPGPELALVPHLPRLSRTAYRFKESLIQLTVLLGEVVTTYRLWILSNRSKTMIAFPIAAVLGFLACAIALSGTANDTTTTPIPIRNGRLKLSNWDIGAICCTVSNTVYVTLMITWIIMKARMAVAPNLIGRGISQALVVVTESAAIYTTWNLLFFIAGLGFQSEIALSFLDCVPAIYGISVMLINVRVGLGRARHDYHVMTPPSQRQNFHTSTSEQMGGVYVSTVLYPTIGASCERSSMTPTQMEEDVRSLSSTVTPTGPTCAV